MSRVWVALLAGVAGALITIPAATPVQSQSAVAVCGSGYGHGVGMSQWGAYGRALAGQSYARIIRAYYSGVQLGQFQDNPRVRVLLGSGATQDVAVRSGRKGRLVNLATGGSVALSPATYRVEYLSARGLYRVTNRTTGASVGSYTGPILFQSAGGGPLGYGSRDYRGELLVRAPGSSRLQTINRLAMETYIRGVVAMEMPSSWHAEALKAQAVAARSYARATMGGEVFDFYADTRDQVYGGASAETPATNEAVTATARTYAVYDGSPITAYFFSASGGYTEDSRYVFGEVPYLKAIRDVDASGRKFERRAGSPWTSWSGTLDPDGSGFGVGTITGVKVLERSPSGRAMQVRITGTAGSTVVSGQNNIRFGLKSTGVTRADGSSFAAGPLPSARISFGSGC